MITKQTQKFKRAAFLIRTLVKYGFEDLLIRSGIHKRFAGVDYGKEGSNKQAAQLSIYERIRMVLEELGSAYVKFGQIMSSREDLLPMELIIELKKLQDQVKAEQIDVKKLIEEELNIHIDNYFEDIDIHPIASASIAQVYKGYLTGGFPVIIKIKRSNISEMMQTDLLLMKDVVKILVNYSEVLKRINLIEIFDAFEQSLKEELSFLQEQNNIQQFERNFKNNERVKTVKVFPHLCNDNILCMEFIEGIKISEKELIRERGIDLDKLAVDGLQVYLTQVLEHGFFHADPHPGNIFVLDNAKIAFIDFGSVGKMLPVDKAMLEDFILYFIGKDIKKLIITIKKMSVRANIPDEHKLERDILAIFSMLEANSIKNIDVKLFFRKFSALLNENEILMPSHIYLLVRGIVLIESIGRDLSPEMNIIERIRPYMFRILKKRLGLAYFLGKSVEHFNQLKDALIDMPLLIKSIVQKIDSGDIKIKHEMLPATKENRQLGKNNQLLYLAVICSGIFIGSSILILADKPPKILEMPVLAVIGFMICFIIGIKIFISRK